MPVMGVSGCAGRAGELSYDPGFDLLSAKILLTAKLCCSDVCFGKIF